MSGKLTNTERYQEEAFDEKAGTTKIYTVGGRDNRNHRFKIQKIMNRLRLQQNDTVLEVGAGAGEHAARLLHIPTIHYTGIDISQKSLDVAAERLTQHAGRFVLQQDNANALSFGDASFDGVFCAATLHHMEKPLQMILEMARVLKPGGRLTMMEPNWLYPTNIGFMLLLKEDRHMWLMRRGNFLSWLKQAGLVEIEVENFLYTPPVPKSFIPMYDWLDRFCSRVIGLRRCSLMLSGSGTKPGKKQATTETQAENLNRAL